MSKKQIKWFIPNPYKGTGGPKPGDPLYDLFIGVTILKVPKFCSCGKQIKE